MFRYIPRIRACMKKTYPMLPYVLTFQYSEVTPVWSSKNISVGDVNDKLREREHLTSCYLMTSSTLMYSPAASICPRHRPSPRYEFPVGWFYNRSPHRWWSPGMAAQCPLTGGVHGDLSAGPAAFHRARGFDESALYVIGDLSSGDVARG